MLQIIEIIVALVFALAMLVVASAVVYFRFLRDRDEEVRGQPSDFFIAALAAWLATFAIWLAGTALGVNTTPVPTYGGLIGAGFLLYGLVLGLYKWENGAYDA